MRHWKFVGWSSLVAVAVAACGAGNSKPNIFEPPKAGASGAGGTTQPSAGTGGSDDGEGGTAGSGEAGNPGSAGSLNIGGSGTGLGGTGNTVICSNEPADADGDGDGYTPDDGDFNDCDPLVNPGAIDVINYKKDADGNATDEPLPDDEQIDEDCDGVALLPSDPPVTCDGGLGPKIGDAFDAARAMGLCNVGVEAEPANAKDRKWGVISAKFSDIAGSFLTSPPKSGANADLQLGILPNLGEGTKPFEGENFFALSSGIARAPGQDGFDEKVACAKGTGSKAYNGSTSAYPPGFPKQGDCGTSGTPNDGIALDLRLRVPTNAKSFKFNFRFFTCEYPVYVCSQYNDVFAVLMAPSPLENGDPMADKTNSSANIAFEATDAGKKNVIGVNNTSFLTDCELKSSGKTAPYVNCGGVEQLVGSGFDGHAASGWLESQVPIPDFAPGADRVISLRFAIWDSSDHAQDSSAVVDNFRWSAEEGTGVGTVIVPVPK
jgi:hypothetical protein